MGDNMANHPTVTSDLSTTITAGGTAQTLSAAKSRMVLVIANPDASEDLWVAFNGLTAAANGTGSLRIPANGGVLSFAGDAPQSAVSIIGATTGHKITAWEG
jgi:hypothetical protein